MNLEAQLATAALDTLHGSRALPAAEAATELRDFLDSISTPIPNSARLERFPLDMGHYAYPACRK
jgi:hypothetical protein